MLLGSALKGLKDVNDSFITLLRSWTLFLVTASVAVLKAPECHRVGAPTADKTLATGNSQKRWSDEERFCVDRICSRAIVSAATRLISSALLMKWLIRLTLGASHLYDLCDVYVLCLGDAGDEPPRRHATSLRCIWLITSGKFSHCVNAKSIYWRVTAHKYDILIRDKNMHEFLITNLWSSM